MRLPDKKLKLKGNSSKQRLPYLLLCCPSLSLLPISVSLSHISKAFWPAVLLASQRTSCTWQGVNECDKLEIKICIIQQCLPALPLSLSLSLSLFVASLVAALVASAVPAFHSTHSSLGRTSHAKPFDNNKLL